MLLAASLVQVADARYVDDSVDEDYKRELYQQYQDGMFDFFNQFKKDIATLDRNNQEISNIEGKIAILQPLKDVPHVDIVYFKTAANRHSLYGVRTVKDSEGNYFILYDTVNRHVDADYLIERLSDSGIVVIKKRVDSGYKLFQYNLVLSQLVQEAAEVLKDMPSKVVVVEKKIYVPQTEEKIIEKEKVVVKERIVKVEIPKEIIKKQYIPVVKKIYINEEGEEILNYEKKEKERELNRVPHLGEVMKNNKNNKIISVVDKSKPSNQFKYKDNDGVSEEVRNAWGNMKDPIVPVVRNTTPSKREEVVIDRKEASIQREEITPKRKEVSIKVIEPKTIERKPEPEVSKKDFKHKKRDIKHFMSKIRKYGTVGVKENKGGFEEYEIVYRDSKKGKRVLRKGSILFDIKILDIYKKVGKKFIEYRVLLEHDPYDGGHTIASFTNRSSNKNTQIVNELIKQKNSNKKDAVTEAREKALDLINEEMEKERKQKELDEKSSTNNKKSSESLESSYYCDFNKIRIFYDRVEQKRHKITSASPLYKKIVAAKIISKNSSRTLIKVGLNHPDIYVDNKNFESKRQYCEKK